jgi:LPS sulfotransferase NodH
MKSVYTLSSAHQSLDLPEFSGQPTRYVVASQPRSGSHYLSRLLRETAIAGFPLEYFHPRHWQEWCRRCGSDTASHVFKILTRRRTSRNGIFGVKTHWNQFAQLVNLGLEAEFRDARFVYLVREDVLGQAISHAIALQTGQWVNAQSMRKDPVYSQTAIESSIALVLHQRHRWEQFFCLTGIAPLRLTYESLIDNPRTRVRCVLDFIGVPAELGEQHMAADQKSVQRSEINEIWRQRFLSGVTIRNDERWKWRHLLKEHMTADTPHGEPVDSPHEKHTQ